MNNILQKIQIYWKFILGGILLLLIIGGVYLYSTSNKIEEVVKESPIILNNTATTTEELIKETIFVDVKGAVKKPGVYELVSGSRVIDAITKSGGLNKDADTSIINLSKKLADGNVIIIYTKNKIEELHKQEVIIEYIEKECKCPDNSNSACIDKDDVIIEDNNEDIKDTSPSKVSLNTASKEELMTISGIGESKAADIIKYRNANGEFKTIEDIKNVKGIGDALFEKIKKYITI